MSDVIRFTLDGQAVTAEPDETIWQVAKRSGIEIPHLCYTPEPGYRADGNCRACMVEIEGERVLAASCIRKPTEGMEVRASVERAVRARDMVMELLIADQPPPESSHDPSCELWDWAATMERTTSRFPARQSPAPDLSHTAMAVNLDACIHCTRCVRACREVQVNDVIGMAGRGARNKIVFDFDDPMGESTCVACGECVQACPTGALMPAKEVGKEVPAKKVESVCPYCGVGCQLTFNVKDNKILWVDGKDGPANHGRLCVKGRFGFDYVSHPHRLTTPLIRRDDAPKSAEIDIDPANPLTHFREASWDEALDRAAEGLQQIRNQHGANALAGFGSAKGSNEEAYLFQKLVRAGFGTNNVDHCTRLCHASSVAALLECIGSGAVTASFNQVEHSDVIIVIGAQPTVNHPVAATFFKNAAKRGANLIVIDPRGSALARHASPLPSVQARHGRGAPQRPDARHRRGGALRPAICRGPHGGIRATERPSRGLCAGGDGTGLRHRARRPAQGRASLRQSRSGDHLLGHGHLPAHPRHRQRALPDLAGAHRGPGGPPGQRPPSAARAEQRAGRLRCRLIPMMYPDYQPVTDPTWREKFSDIWGADLDPNAGLTVVEVMNAAHEGAIKGMYIMGENPAMSDPNLRHVREALASLDHLVVQELFLTETACYADVVLPASAWPEKDGTVTNTNRQVQMGRTALTMPDGAKQDWWIIQELARRIGLDWNYGGPADVFAEMAGCMPSLDNISWERLRRESAVTYPCSGEDEPGHDVIFEDGYPTTSKRGKLVPASIVPPDESPDDEFPLVLTTGRMLEHWHTGAMTRRASVLDHLEPEAVAHLAPAELERMHIKPGTPITVETRRGAIGLRARADAGVPAGVVFVPFCFAEAAGNMLTNPALDPFGKIPEFKYCAARVTRADAPAEAAE